MNRTVGFSVKSLFNHCYPLGLALSQAAAMPGSSKSRRRGGGGHRAQTKQTRSVRSFPRAISAGPRQTRSKEI